MATLYTVAVEGEMCPRFASIVDRIVDKFFVASGREVTWSAWISSQVLANAETMQVNRRPW